MGHYTSFGKYCDSPPLRRKLCDNCDTKPVLAAQIDFFDELRLLILNTNLPEDFGLQAR